MHVTSASLTSIPIPDFSGYTVILLRVAPVSVHFPVRGAGGTTARGTPLTDMPLLSSSRFLNEVCQGRAMISARFSRAGSDTTTTIDPRKNHNLLLQLMGGKVVTQPK